MILQRERFERRIVVARIVHVEFGIKYTLYSMSSSFHHDRPTYQTPTDVVQQRKLE